MADSLATSGANQIKIGDYYYPLLAMRDLATLQAQMPIDDCSLVSLHDLYQYLQSAHGMEALVIYMVKVLRIDPKQFPASPLELVSICQTIAQASIDRKMPAQENNGEDDGKKLGSTGEN